MAELCWCAGRASTVRLAIQNIIDRLIVGISDVLGVIWLLCRAPTKGAVTELISHVTR